MYDFLYKDKIEPHFSFRSQQIEVVEDYFGTEEGENIQAKTNSEISFQNTNTSFEELLIERNSHICQFDDLESKFKALFTQQINEFFLSVIHLSVDDPFDELIDNSEKIRGFMDICTELIERHNIKYFYTSRNRFYEKKDKEPNFFDEINKMQDEDSDKEYNSDHDKRESSLNSIKTMKKNKSIGAINSFMSLFDPKVFKKKHSGISISKKIRYYRKSQSVMESNVADFFEPGLHFNIDAPSDPKALLLKRMKSCKTSQFRKIMSAAQTFRIENRFNKNKLKRKRRIESIENKLKVGSGLGIQKLRSNAMDLMFST